VAGRPVKGATAWVDSSAQLPTKKGASREGKGERDEKETRGTSPASRSPRGVQDVTVGTIASGHLDAQPVVPKHATWDAA
jgi:hypothetical protein